eukprot:gene26525-34736_t
MMLLIDHKNSVYRVLFKPQRVFEHILATFEAQGWTVLAPDLPGRDGAGSAAGRSISDFVTSVADLCASMAERPVLLGHSMGGLVCQLAARRVNAAAIALLAPSAPWGVHGSSMEEAATAFGVQLADPFWMGTVSPDRGLMRTHGLDRVPKSEQDMILERLCPESGRAVREVLNWWLDPFMTTSLGPGVLPMPSLVIAGAVVAFNNTPRQCLDFRTPVEVFSEIHLPAFAGMTGGVGAGPQDRPQKARHPTHRALNLMAASLPDAQANSRTGLGPAAPRRPCGPSLTWPGRQARIIREIWCGE